MLPRWQKHWWEWTEPRKTEPEPTVWVDPSLVIEQPTTLRRMYARGTTPPPTAVGAYCEIVEPARTDD